MQVQPFFKNPRKDTSSEKIKLQLSPESRKNIQFWKKWLVPTFFRVPINLQVLTKLQVPTFFKVHKILIVLMDSFFIITL